MQHVERRQVIIELICEFVEAFTHQVLYLRGVYDQDIFERERLYGIAVHKSRHPGLNLYISEAILDLRDGIAAEKVQKIVIKVEDQAGSTKERYVLALQVGQESSDIVHSERLESLLRSFLLKLQFNDACLRPLPEGCTFSIEAHTCELSAVPKGNWVEENSLEDSQSNSSRHTIVPIKSASLGSHVKLQLHAEVP